MTDQLEKERILVEQVSLCCFWSVGYNTISREFFNLKTHNLVDLVRSAEDVGPHIYKIETHHFFFFENYHFKGTQ